MIKLNDPVKNIQFGYESGTRLKTAQKALLAAYDTFNDSLVNQAKARMGKKLTVLEDGRVSYLMAEKYGLSRQTVNFGRTVIKYGCPELVNRVREGHLAISVAAKIAKMPFDLQIGILSMNKKEITKRLNEVYSNNFKYD